MLEVHRQTLSGHEALGQRLLTSLDEKLKSEYGSSFTHASTHTETQARSCKHANTHSHSQSPSSSSLLALWGKVPPPTPIYLPPLHLPPTRGSRRPSQRGVPSVAPPPNPPFHPSPPNLLRLPAPSYPYDTSLDRLWAPPNRRISRFTRGTFTEIILTLQYTIHRQTVHHCISKGKGQEKTWCTLHKGHHSAT